MHAFTFSWRAPLMMWCNCEMEKFRRIGLDTCNIELHAVEEARARKAERSHRWMVGTPCDAIRNNYVKPPLEIIASLVFILCEKLMKKTHFVWRIVSQTIAFILRLMKMKRETDNFGVRLFVECLSAERRREALSADSSRQSNREQFGHKNFVFWKLLCTRDLPRQRSAPEKKQKPGTFSSLLLFSLSLYNVGPPFSASQ